jgi:hypothetical protein
MLVLFVQSIKLLCLIRHINILFSALRGLLILYFKLLVWNYRTYEIQLPVLMP